MSQVYNIKINTKDGKSIDLGEFNIFKTDLKDIKNKLEQIHGYDKNSISFIYMCEKEKKISISMDAFISEEISHHKEFGNQYIDNLKIREVLDHLELYGTPEYSHIFTEIGSKQLKEKEKTKTLINHYRYCNPEYLECIWRSNKVMGSLFLMTFILTVLPSLIIAVGNNQDEQSNDKKDNLIPKKLIDIWLLSESLLLTGFFLSYYLDSKIGYNSKVFVDKTTLLSKLIREEPHTVFYENQKYKRLLEITLENNQRINVVQFSTCPNEGICSNLLDQEYFHPPQGINTMLKDLKQELDKIEKNEQKEKISREIENNINNELEESLLGVCTL